MKWICMITAICVAALLASCGHQLQMTEKNQVSETSEHVLQPSPDDVNRNSDELQVGPDTTSEQFKAEAPRNSDESHVTVESAEFLSTVSTGSGAQYEEIAVHVTGLVWNKSSDLTLSVGDSNRRTAATTPAGGAATYTSSDTAVATVDATGNVICKAAGKTVITATSGDVSVSYNLTVAAAPASSVSSPANGSGVFAGYTVMVLDHTTPATTASGNASFTVYTFYSSSGKALGSISGTAQQSIVDKYHTTSSSGEWVAPGNGGNWESWFAEQFNLYRGLREDPTVTSNNLSSNSKLDKSLEVQELERLANNKRELNGLDRLGSDSSISSLADTRAQELENDFSHVRPDGTTVSENGYAEICTQSQSALGALNNFMNSTAHKDILLTEKWNYIGVGCYQASNGTIYWVILFQK